MAISTEAIRTLRERTGAGIMDCKKALEQAGDDMEKAGDLLRMWGLAIVAKKALRTAHEGVVAAYVHAGGRIGALVELNCETDFVARTPEFQNLAHELCLQVAAMAPQIVEDERALDDLDSTQGEPRLLFQPFIKDPARSVRDVISDVVARVGENIQVKRFVRFEVGI